MRKIQYFLISAFALLFVNILQASEDPGTIYLESNSMAAMAEAPATPPAPTATQYCGYTRVTRATPPSGVTYYWQTSSTGTSTANSSLNYDVTSNRYVYLRAYNGQWSTSYSRVYASVKTVPANPSVTSASRCGPGIVQITATPPSGSTINWYEGSTLKASSESTYSPNLTTTKNFTAKSVQSGCESSGATATATIKAIPATPSGTGATKCGSGNLTIRAYTSTTGASIKWTEYGTLITTDATNDSYLTRNLNTTTSYRAQAILNGCVSGVTGDIVATVKAVPGQPTATGDTRCGPGVVQLTASPPSGSTINWYEGSTLKASSESTYSPNLTTTKSFTAKSVLSGCESAGVAVTATIKTIPATPTGTGASKCGPGDLTIRAYTSTTGASIKWTEYGTLVTTDATNDSYLTRNLNTTTSYRAQAILNGCVSSVTGDIVATVYPIPAAPTTNSSSRCGPGTVTLSASGATTGETYHWYTASSGGTAFLNNSSSYTTGSLSATTIYYVQKNNANCIGTSRTPVTATIKTTPVITSSSGDSRVEAGELNLSATASPSTSFIYWYLSSNTTNYLSEGPSYNPIQTSTRDYKIQARYNNCVSDFVSVTGEIIPLIYTKSSVQTTPPAGFPADVPFKDTELGIDYIYQNTLNDGTEIRTNFNLYPNGGTFNLDIACNTNWEITHVPDWIAPEGGYPTSGNNSFSLALDFDRYYNADGDRQDYIGINVGVGTEDKIYITQPTTTLSAVVDGGTVYDNTIKDATVYLSTNTLHLGGGSEAVEYNITNYEGELDILVHADSDIEWNIVVENSDLSNEWLMAPNVGSGIGTQHVIVPIKANFGGSRKGVIKIMHDIVPVYIFYLEQFSTLNYDANTPMNYVRTKVYGEGSRRLSEGIQYYDKLGKPTQSISRDISRNMVVASQALYDEYGRNYANTLPVPVDQQSLNYIDEFLDESTLKSLNEIGNTTICGKYYSTNNTDEPYVPDDRYAFSKVQYSQTIPGAVRRSYAPGLRMHQHPTVAFTVNAAPEEITNLDIASYLNISTLKALGEGTNDISDYEGMVKSVTRDIMGKEAVTYTNAEGRVIASAMVDKSTTSRTFLITNTIKTEGEAGYIDFHLPDDGLGTYTLTKLSSWGSELVSLESDMTIASGTESTITNVQPGFYRMVCYSTTAGDVIVNFKYTIGTLTYYSFNAYDEAGRLVRTISPKDVEEIVEGNVESDLQAELDERLTQNTYGKFGRLMSTYSQDEGLTKFAYRRDGSLRASQNAEQRKDNKISYSNYDEHGRVVEVGEYYVDAPVGDIIDALNGNQTVMEQKNVPGDGFIGEWENCSHRTFTQYDEPDPSCIRSQKFLRGTVSKTWNENSTTWYSYNYDGTVAWTIQKINGFDKDDDGSDERITLDYVYDYIGNVTEVIYQAGKDDEFTHFYEYDLDNRLKAVYTQSNNNINNATIGQWSLDNNTTDNSVYLNDGILHGAAPTKDRLDNSAGAYQFDGVDDYVEIGDVDVFNQDFDEGITISAWFKLDAIPSETGKNVSIISKGGSFGYLPRSSFNLTFYQGNNRLYFDLWDENSGTFTRSALTSAKTDWEVDRWYHVLVTWDGTMNAYSQKMYIDGTLNAQRTATVDKIWINDQELQIGNSLAMYFDGAIDEVKVYSGPFTTDEALALYNDESTPNEKTLQAKYYYYQHGPLKRVEYGEDLQGVDYVYTVNGWLKSINNPNGNDPGSDGSGVHAQFAEDIFAMALDYYNGDYIRTGTNLGNAPAAANYDGNIYQQRFNNKGTVAATTGAQSTWRYAYDKRNFLESATFGTFDAATSAFLGANPYKVTNLTYDANGNIQSLDRYNQQGNNYDKLRYNYLAGRNQLDFIQDLGDNGTLTDDETFESQASGNYEYNDIGQLVHDASGTAEQDETIANPGHRFTYDPYGKVTAVTSSAGSSIAQYVYNESGFRIKKTDDTGKTTWYIRDASGSIMGIYITEAGNTKLTEQPLYGSGRIGLATTDGNGTIAKYTFELSDHLGNVRATFTSDGTGDADTDPDILTAADYYPFGLEMKGRTFNSGNYRFGYQGQFAEKDEETGYNQFEARLFDARIGRWMIPDPAGQYWSPYLGMGNNPLLNIDPNGKSSFMYYKNDNNYFKAGVYYYVPTDWKFEEAYAQGLKSFHPLGFIIEPIVNTLTWNIDGFMMKEMHSKRNQYITDGAQILALTEYIKCLRYFGKVASVVNTGFGLIDVTRVMKINVEVEQAVNYLAVYPEIEVSDQNEIIFRRLAIVAENAMEILINDKIVEFIDNDTKPIVHDQGVVDEYNQMIQDVYKLLINE